jgi:hypothetical protein
MSREVITVEDAPVMMVPVTMPDPSDVAGVPGPPETDVVAGVGGVCVSVVAVLTPGALGRGLDVPSSRVAVTLTSSSATGASCAYAEVQLKTATPASSAARR